MEKKTSVNPGNLEKAGWKQTNTNLWSKDGYSVWYYANYVLQINATKSSEACTRLGEGLKTIEEIDSLILANPVSSPDKGETTTGAGEQVCCRMLKDPDTKEYGDKIRSLCGWECMPLTQTKGIEAGKSLDDDFNNMLNEIDKFHERTEKHFENKLPVNQILFGDSAFSAGWKAHKLYASQQQGWINWKEQKPELYRELYVYNPHNSSVMKIFYYDSHDEPTIFTHWMYVSKEVFPPSP